MSSVESLLRRKLSTEDYGKLAAIDNPAVHRFVADSVALCEPDSVFVATDSPEDIAYVRRYAIETGEEQKLAMDGHTVHFDGYHDQARDKANTKYLLPPGIELGTHLNSVDKESGLAEVRSYLKGSARGKELFVRFFCLGPPDSPFCILAVQLTDSSYVAHSQDILYRHGYEAFRKKGNRGDFFRLVHSQGRLEGGVSADVEKRRVYIDLEENIVYSSNTQYAGNTIGLKKLSLRLAINKASQEGWLAEHMLIVGIHGPGGRLTYFTGAFPSACGKTSTAMIPGESILGDDLAYLRVVDDEARGANVESGIFGIIRNVNATDDPIIWEALHTPRETIFSNVLVTDEGVPYWLGMGEETPETGRNHGGEWWPGKTDEDGKKIPLAHRNARYTIRLETLANCDPRLHDPKGVKVSGVVYGGRDSDTSVPVEQAFDWTHGIITKAACLESETTSATLGKEGQRVLNPMSNLDFVSVPLGRYIQNNISFGEGLRSKPLIFGLNYFLKDAKGRYLSAFEDKRVWLKWAELRVHDEVDAIRRPTGLIPRYEDLKRLFRQHLQKDYSQAEYEEQFAPRIDKNLAKLDRIEKIYRESVPDTPEVLFEILKEQRARLEAAR